MTTRPARSAMKLSAVTLIIWSAETMFACLMAMVSIVYLSKISRVSHHVINLSIDFLTRKDIFSHEYRDFWHF